MEHCCCWLSPLLFIEERGENRRRSKVFLNVFGLTDVEGKIIEVIEQVWEVK
jgi:hypothetical protein